MFARQFLEVELLPLLKQRHNAAMYLSNNHKLANDKVIMQLQVCETIFCTADITESFLLTLTIYIF